MSLPKCLSYSSIKPRGFPSQFKRWEVNPQTSYTTYNNNDIIRFIFETKDFIDPYQSYVEVEVTFDPNSYPPQLSTDYDATVKPSFMLDGPSTSLFQQMVLYSNSKEVERIQEYDQVGNLLADMGMPIECRFQKAFEGYAAQRMMSGTNFQGGDLADSVNSNSYVTCGGQTYAVGGSGANNTWQDMPNGGRKESIQLAKPMGRIPAVLYNALVGGGNANASLTQTNVAHGMNMANFLNQLSAPNDAALPNFNIGDITHFAKGNQQDALCCYQNQRWPVRNFAHEYAIYDSAQGVQDARSNVSGAFGWQYKDTEYDYTNLGEMIASNDDPMQDVASSKANDLGYYRGTTPGSSLNHSSYVTPFIPTMAIVNGKPQQGQYMNGLSRTSFSNTPELKNFTVTKKTYYVPILSGVLGTLIPKDQWKLIPGEGCGQLLFEWTLNPYAFFASGHGMTYAAYQQKRLASTSPLDFDCDPINSCYQIKWNVTKISMHFDLWSFGDVVQQQIRQSLQGEGILMTSQGFTMGPIYTVSQTSEVKNNWHINNGVLSLRTIYFWFLSNDYLNYSYCRKNYKLSQNLKYMWLKIGTQYIPQQPIKGNAGQLQKNQYFQTDYTEFYAELQRTTGSLFSCWKTINVAPEQFVLNDRPYNPSSFKQTHSQQALWHETRARGQATYGFDLLADPFDQSVLSGIDTTQFRPIELVLDVNSDTKYSGDYNRPSTMYILLHHDMLVSFKLGGIETAGQG